jgi:cytidine deaminase
MIFDDETCKILIAEALKAREMAYTPYSHFAVGAALLCRDGTVYTGCNIENAAYTPTNCAERTAVFKAVSEGKKTFDAIAIVGGPQGSTPAQRGYCPPCGVCRQVLMEFVNPDEFQIILGKTSEDYKVVTLSELLPMGFGPANLV